MVIGYVNAKNMEGQRQQILSLESYGIDKWYGEAVDGKLNRETLDKLKAENLISTGDELVITELAVLPLTALQAIEFITGMLKQHINIVCIEHEIDMKFVKLLHDLHKRTRKERSSGVLSEYAKVRTGRKRKVSEADRLKGQAAAHLYKEYYLTGKKKIQEVMDESGIKGKKTLYKRLRENGIEPGQAVSKSD
jgi:DNA-binding cell septation regulator SpoVG